MKGNHFIFDFETLGTNLIRGFPVLECSYAVFDASRFIENPYTFEELVGATVRSAKLDVKHQVSEYGYEIESETIKWWKNKKPEVFAKVVKPSLNDMTVGMFIDDMFTYIEKNNVKYWWSRSNTFDPIILLRLAGEVGAIDRMHTILKVWSVRDTRTFIDAKFNFEGDNNFILDEWKEKFEAHNSVHDVAIDILRLQKITQMENE